MLVSHQIRAARGFLNWSARVLAERAGIGMLTVYRMERAGGPLTGNNESVRRVQDVLERAGIEFHTDHDGLGVRLAGTRDASRWARRMRLMERVVGLDPQFAGGYATMSEWLALQARQGQSASPEADVERAFQLAQKAVAVDPTFARSHSALGNAYLMMHQHDKAIAAAQEAIRIQPNYAGGHDRLGYFLHWAGRGEEAIDAVKTAMQLDPKPSKRRAIRRASYLGMAYFTAGRYQDAIAAFKKHHKRRVRRGALGLGVFAATYAATGQDEKARAVMKALLEKKPGLTISNYGHLQPYKRKEDRDRLVKFLRKAGMPELHYVGAT